MEEKAILELAKYHYQRIVSDTKLLLLYAIASNADNLVVLTRDIVRRIRDINKRLEKTNNQ